MKNLRIVFLSSIVLLFIPVFGSKKSNLDCCEKESHVICANECGDCCIDECCCYKFFTCLNFDQVVVAGGIVRRLEKDRPGTGKNEVHGTFELCFNKGFTKAFYKLTVYNVNKGRHNANENLLGAALYKGGPDQGIGESNGMPGDLIDPIVYLCGLESQGVVRTDSGGDPLPTDPECGSIVCDWCCCGTFANKDLLKSSDITFVKLRHLYESIILRGDIFIMVNGSETCLASKPKYGSNFGGLIRGQLDKASLVKNCLKESC